MHLSPPKAPLASNSPILLRVRHRDRGIRVPGKVVARLYCRCKRTQDGEPGSAHLRRRCETCRRASMLISGRRRRRVGAGLGHCYKTAGTRPTRCHGETRKRARKSPGRVLVLGTNCQSNGTLGTPMISHLLGACHLKLSIPSQVVPVLVPRPRVGDCVGRELRPCSELVTVSRKMESEVEFVPLRCSEVAATGRPFEDHQG